MCLNSDLLNNHDLPTHYCYKYNPYRRLNEEYEKDSDGDLINVAMDGAHSFPEFVASSNIVTPKYLVHAKKTDKKFVKFYNFILPLFFTIAIVWYNDIVLIINLNEKLLYSVLDDKKKLKIFGPPRTWCTKNYCY